MTALTATFIFALVCAAVAVCAVVAGARAERRAELAEAMMVLQDRGLIEHCGGDEYRITQAGLRAVRVDEAERRAS